MTASDLRECPGCGNVPQFDRNDEDNLRLWFFAEHGGGKWGRLECCFAGPEVRAGYAPIKDWMDAAIEEWNRRPALPSVPTVEEINEILLRKGRILEDGQRAHCAAAILALWKDKPHE